MKLVSLHQTAWSMVTILLDIICEKCYIKKEKTLTSAGTNF